MEVGFKVDLDNPQQVANLIKVLEGFLPTGEAPQPDKVEPKKETPKKATPRKSTPKKETPKKEETPKEEVEETPKEETQDTDGQEVKIEDLRALVAEKKDNHRAAIKEKLTEFGVKNVTTLQKENYEAFRDFLKAL